MRKIFEEQSIIDAEAEQMKNNISIIQRWQAAKRHQKPIIEVW